MKTDDSLATHTVSSQSSWIRHLWQSITAPIGSTSADKQTNEINRSEPNVEDQTSTRSPELAPPLAIIETQTLKAFSDRVDEYEPADLALIDFIPAELALLDISPSQPAISSTSEIADSTSTALIEVADATADDEFDCDSDDEYLNALVSLELPELSEEIEKTLPDLSAF